VIPINSSEGISLKEHYIRYLNACLCVARRQEVPEMRKKKYLCSKEMEVSKFKYFPNEEAEQNNLKRIYSDGRESPKSS